MNLVTLVGRLTKDPEIRYFDNGGSICNFSLAVDRPYKSQSGEKITDFHNIKVNGKRGENCSKYLAKGSQVALCGTLENRTYQAQDGSNRYITEVNANDVQFLDTKKSENAQPVAEAPVDPTQLTDEDLANVFGNQDGVELNPDDYPFDIN